MEDSRNEPNVNQTINSILNYIKEGEKNLVYPTETHPNIILVLGNTGSGKTTFVHHIAKDNSKLISTPVTNPHSKKPTGDYIIEDTDEKISRSTIHSQTLIPELTIDPVIKTSFYDCPGFQDTRSAIVDIGATYFTTRIANTATAIKFVFIVNYKSVNLNFDKKDFISLARHATNMIKNIDKFKDGICLVANKVSNDEKTDMVYNTIATYLHSARDELVEEVIRSKNGQGTHIIPNLEQLNRVIKFIDALLIMDGEHNYTKLGFLRRPAEAGPLSGITSMQAHKDTLLKLVHQNTRYIKHDDENDFSYTVSADSLNYVSNLMHIIHQQVTNNINGIVNHIQQYYDNLIKQVKNTMNSFTTNSSPINVDLLEIQTFISKINTGRNIIEKLAIEVKRATNLVDLFNKLDTGMSNLDIPDDHISQHIVSISSRANFSIFSQHFYNPILPTHQWSAAFNTLTNYLSICTNRLQASATTAKTEIESKMNADMLKSADSLKSRFCTEEANIKEHKISFHRFDNYHQQLSRIQTTLKIVVDPKECIEKFADELTKINILSGNAIFSNIIKQADYLEYLKILVVQSANTFKCTEGLDQVNKFLVDTKIWYLFLQELYESLSRYEIQRDTKKYNAIEITPLLMEYENISVGNNTSLNSFLKSCCQRLYQLRYVSIENIILNKPKLNALQRIIDITLIKDLRNKQYNQPCHSSKFVLKGQFVKLSDAQNTTCPEPIKFIEVFALNKAFIDVSLYLGKIQLTIVSPIWEIQGIQRLVLSGVRNSTADSIGNFIGYGETCLYCKNLVISTAGARQSHVDGHVVINFFSKDQDNIRILTDNGRTVSSFITSSPKTSRATFFANPSHAINSYKNFLRENLSSSIRESDLINFLDKLDHDPLINDLYNTWGFYNELYQLESQFYGLYKTLSFTPFYKTLLQRIGEYVQHVKPYETSEDYKIVLTYLYTAALSRSNAIRRGSNDFVIEISLYLDSVLKHIEIYKDVTHSIQIDQTKSLHDTELMKKITEARQFIDTDITKELNTIIPEIENQMKVLIKDIKSMQQLAHYDKKELEKKRAKLKKRSFWRRILEPIKLIGQVLNFAGPIGVMANAAIQSASMVAEPFIFRDTSSPVQSLVKTLPSATMNVFDQVKEQLKIRQQMFNDQVNTAKQEFHQILQKEPNNAFIQQLYDKITIYQENVNNNQINKTLKSELKNSIETTLAKLTSQNSTSGGIKAIYTKIRENLAIIGKVGELAKESYDIIADAKTELAQNDDEIKQLNGKIQLLEQHEQNVYEIMMPSCKQIEQSITQLSSTLPGKSHVALDVSKWKMQSTIREFQVLVRKMTEGFTVEEALRRCIEKLEHGMTIMIQVYDRIEEYHEHKELTDYIYDLSSQRVQNIRINNTELSSAVDNLKILIHSNIVLKEYEKATEAFLQYKFPFAHNYLEEFQLPLYFRMKNTTDNLVQQSITKINSMKTKLVQNRASIDQTEDRYMILNAFDGKPGHFSPFFVWKHQTDIEAITNLLQGKPVTIEADIVKSSITQNAIKFKEIGIRFKLLNSSLQAEFDAQLTNLSVEMIHLGNSYYACDGKIYIISHSNQAIRHSINKNDEGKYEMLNEVYNKIQNHDAVLSPYTLWNIKLLHDNRNDPYDFAVLNKYLNQPIDLHLEGTGKYLERNDDTDMCNNLQHYYALHRVISETADDVQHQQRHRRRRHNIQNSEDPLELIASKQRLDAPSNSASTMTSPVNYVLSWLSIFNPATIIKSFSRPIPLSIKLPNQEGEGIKHDTVSSTSSVFDINQSLLLIDFVIKYFTKSKPCNTDDPPIDLQHLKGYVLEIITEFETLLNDEFSQAKLEFDPITLMAKLEQKIINDDHSQIANVLHQSLILNDDCHASDFDKISFHTHLQRKITKMLQRGNIGLHNCQLITDWADNSNIRTIENLGVSWSEKSHDVASFQHSTLKISEK